ncbi:hypothetical protein CcaverHIS002_0207590 [Cutaneotrichosporon cavernicola]|uniref:CHCH domain-containing protein n=1 Tax=Cutaneotrichosporon cavernicola TaxID=279322 RepID=A0AA48I1H9_9TREE|nr:uncharacterized protein CcaverHIS019_0207580 [Cutaneotrichosporon cavernicola]BEI81599.1 hypothetical protein CcaverHIS002_0207590 [Cutaneotrichosporon cavernicola]BEI89396.1 hypothetical protein CcaverHIS019_0207580 [Cutaneotrichosporon cavernicola]BEI97170.1 hypothetical protein CcaverHIS631_0207590 [Cutaneotrichosporon cavernicola]BEJ04943.1 hypothetical protein CcaverHIS641_0207600 [Cutaneotrichosporon cavernicola]
MARQSRSRPAARPAAPAGNRQASTAAYPAHTPTPAPVAAPAQAQSSGPGLLAQTASTMGGAMAGSVIGHGISSMLFGGRSDAAPPPPSELPAQQAPVNGGSCDIQAKDFTKCIEATNGDMTGCSYYLEALKACQAAARPY